MRSGARTAVPVLVFAALGCGEKPTEEPAATSKLPRNAVWEPIYSKTIDEKLGKCGLSPLRNATLPEGSCEVRVWAGFGLQAYPIGGHPLDGIVLRKDGDRLSGTRYPRAPTRMDITPPSGWPKFWREVEEAGLFDLPDSSELEGYKPVRDGISYVVELHQGGGYRVYSYGNPRHQDAQEAKQFLRLLDILRTGTGFDSGQ